ncbi:hypothetical protein CE206_29260 (plasmid) [Achromobacter xylosoxidans]|uniref:hypothetical protein n=1 Tax=Alcaligenes xylosoxydans xylosoxydans TaxID=85698 RepID=UPI000DD0FEE5|nr:hypothetical protein [Achromobacter xylosoxidans]AXA80660.1 hypothetical protein CE206_29260 [Achromobacter xylosoxidans]
MIRHINQTLPSGTSHTTTGNGNHSTSPNVAAFQAQVEAAHLLASADRVEELASRLVAPGPKAAHISASETHELAKFVHAAVSMVRGYARTPEAAASPSTGAGAGNALTVHLEHLRAEYAVEDLPVVARLYTTGSPPGRRYRRASTQPGPGEPLCLSSDAALAVRKKDSHIEQLERLTATSQQIRTPATDISLLAAEHRGLRVDYCGFLEHVRQALQQGAREPALAEMVLQLQAHLREMGQRWYANEVAVVDELLQLYCIESDARAALAAGAQCAPRPPAPTGR